MPRRTEAELDAMVELVRRDAVWQEPTTLDSRIDAKLLEASGRLIEDAKMEVTGATLAPVPLRTELAR